MRRANIPERTCIGCRRQRPVRELIRMTAHEGVVEPARHGTPGRGAYLCPDALCFDAAVARRAVTRAFRQSVTMGEQQRALFVEACAARKAVK